VNHQDKEILNSVLLCNGGTFASAVCQLVERDPSLQSSMNGNGMPSAATTAIAVGTISEAEEELGARGAVRCCDP
jgi:hypothetical protein